jgi:hypothetical protein
VDNRCGVGSRNSSVSARHSVTAFSDGRGIMAANVARPIDFAEIINNDIHHL